MASLGLESLTHAQRVTRLYRRSLKHILSWVIERHVWRVEALKLRDRFDATKHITDRRKAHQMLLDGEAEFERLKHPFPYIHPDAPGGTRYERNLPPPPNVLEMTPEEKEWYEEAINGPKHL